MFAKNFVSLLRIPMRRHYVPSMKRRPRYIPTPPRLSNKPSNTPHPPKDPPEEGYDPGALDHIGFQVPYFIRPAVFRQFKTPVEVLGPDAAKNKDYKNAEYFAYHRYSFAELQNHALRFRDERREGGGLQVIYECEEDDDDDIENEDYTPTKDCFKKVEEKPETDPNCEKKP